MLLVRSGDFVLLQKRPSKAIWGGLWSLPESGWRSKTEQACKSAPTLKELLTNTLPRESIAGLAKSIKELKQGNQIKHIFTHRRLWIQIWEGRSAKTTEFFGEDLKWVPLGQLGRYGLPQPIKILLQGLSLAHGDDLKN
jgi:A/G-specific adenine glycosylase